MKMAKTILIVEDETDLREMIGFNLEREGYQCRLAVDGSDALAKIAKELPDLIVLDRMLPNISGDEVLAQLKRDHATNSVPVVLLTAKADESDELVGFAMGADDYVTKPFSMKTLIARIGALMRRSQNSNTHPGAIVLTSGPVVLDTERYTVLADGKPIALTTTEFRILKALMAAEGRLRTRDQLIVEALGINVAVVDRTIDVHVAALRKKLGNAARWMQTIRGAGYAWRQPMDDE